VTAPPAGPAAPAPTRPPGTGPRPATRPGLTATPPRSPSGWMWVCLGLLAASGALGLVAWLGLVWGGVTVAAVGGTVVAGLVHRRRRRTARARGTGLIGSGRGPRGTGRLGRLFGGGRSGRPGRLGGGGRSSPLGGRGAAGPHRPGGGLRSRLPRILGGTRNRAGSTPGGGRSSQSAGGQRRGGRLNPLNWGAGRRRSTSAPTGSAAGTGRKWTNPFRRQPKSSSTSSGSSGSRGGSSGGRPWTKTKAAASRLNPFRKRPAAAASDTSTVRTGTSPAGALAARLNPFRRREKKSTPDRSGDTPRRRWLDRFRRQPATTEPAKGTATPRPAAATTSPAPTTQPAAPPSASPAPPPPAPRTTATPPPRPAEPRHSSRTGDTVTGPARPAPGAVEDMALLEFGKSLESGHDAVAEVAAHYERLATAAEESQPVDSAIPDAIRTAAEFIRQAESILGELPATFKRQHEADIERAGNPRKGPAVEEKADSKNNRGHA
jgi:hypothetical protein